MKITLDHVAAKTVIVLNISDAVDLSHGGRFSPRVLTLHYRFKDGKWIFHSYEVRGPRRLETGELIDTELSTSGRASDARRVPVYYWIADAAIAWNPDNRIWDTL